MHDIYKEIFPQKIKLDSLYTAFEATFMFSISRLLQQRLKFGPQKNILNTTLQRSYIPPVPEDSLSATSKKFHLTLRQSTHFQHVFFVRPVHPRDD
jgi:hypothetical protein